LGHDMTKQDTKKYTHTILALNYGATTGNEQLWSSW
jgi:hypothetical protein